MKLHIITTIKAGRSLANNDLDACGSVLSWQHQMIKQILSVNAIEDVVFYCIPETESKTSKLTSWLFKIDQALSRCKPEYLSDKSISNLMADTNRIIHSDRDKLYHDFVDLNSNNDLIINLSETSLPDRVLTSTQLGCWSVFFGDNNQVPSALVGVREFLNNEKVVVSGILKETPKGESDLVLYKASTSLEPASLCRTREICLNKASFFMPRLIKRIAITNNGAVAEKNTKKWGGVLLESIIDQKKVSKSTNLSLLEYFLLFTRFIKRVFKRILLKLMRTEQWVVILANNKVENQPETDFNTFQEITPPDKEFWADPFLYEREGKDYLFIEVFPYDRELGHLSVMEIDQNGHVGEPKKILERPYHFSYPNIFDYQGNTYMVPETGDNEAIELYQCQSFPDSWSFKYHLMTGIRAYDATFVEHNGLWWMFAAIAENDKCPTTEELHIFYADSPISQKWVPHPQNPVNTDAASARPAGNFYWQNDKLYRPSQDCAGSYGAGINICEIVRLDKNHYEERIVKTYTPDWDESITGLHTFNFNQRFTVSDIIKQKGMFN